MVVVNINNVGHVNFSLCMNMLNGAVGPGIDFGGGARVITCPTGPSCSPPSPRAHGLT